MKCVHSIGTNGRGRRPSLNQLVNAKVSRKARLERLYVAQQPMPAQQALSAQQPLPSSQPQQVEENVTFNQERLLEDHFKVIRFFYFLEKFVTVSVSKLK